MSAKDIKNDNGDINIREDQYFLLKLGDQVV